jgi:hypothetical protein
MIPAQWRLVDLSQSHPSSLIGIYDVRIHSFNIMIRRVGNHLEFQTQRREVARKRQGAAVQCRKFGVDCGLYPSSALQHMPHAREHNGKKSSASPKANAMWGAKGKITSFQLIFFQDLADHNCVRPSVCLCWQCQIHGMQNSLNPKPKFIATNCFSVHYWRANVSLALHVVQCSGGPFCARWHMFQRCE